MPMDDYPGPPSTNLPPPLPNRRKRSRTPGGRRRGAGAPVGKGGISGPRRRRRPPPLPPQPIFGGGIKAGGSVPEVNVALKAKGYQVGGAFAPLSRPPFVGGVAGGPPKGRPTLGPQPRRRRGRGRGGRDV